MSTALNNINEGISRRSEPLRYTPTPDDLRDWKQNGGIPKELGVIDSRPRCCMKPLTYEAGVMLSSKISTWATLWPAFGVCSGDMCCACEYAKISRKILPYSSIVRIRENGSLWLMKSKEEGYAQYSDFFYNWASLFQGWMLRLGKRGIDVSGEYVEVLPIENADAMREAKRHKPELTTEEFFELLSS